MTFERAWSSKNGELALRNDFDNNLVEVGPGIKTRMMKFVSSHIMIIFVQVENRYIQTEYKEIK